MWANPTDVIEKLLAIPSDQIGSGTALELERAIARAAPSSPFAQDLKAGPAGIVMAALGIGAVTAVAIPLLMDGLRRPAASPVRDKPEIFANLDHVSEAATRAYLEHGAFPIGEAALTPATSCCKGSSNHCVAPPAAWQVPVWKALQFAPDKPTLFQYAYRSDGKTFSLKAVGDLDCDGVSITWELRGSSVNGKPKIERIPPANDD